MSQNPKNHVKSFKLTPSCLRFSLFSMKRTNKKTKGREKTCNKGEREKREGEKHLLFFFLKSDKMLGLPAKKRLFKVLSLTLSSK